MQNIDGTLPIELVNIFHLNFINLHAKVKGPQQLIANKLKTDRQLT